MQQNFNEIIPIQDFAENSYLDYAMYVILDRALPSIIDGLKPVQRRIIYAMSELHLNYLAKHKKSARTIGDVLGKFHPHGEAACYEAMVLMAQTFSTRYPLIEGQGNFGSADDPKSFAAMRYTEAKLSKYANILLDEISDGAVVWNDNFDGTLKEPKFLPAKLPMVLLNGTTGIAVGMATDLLPHNLKEVADACIHILNQKDPKKLKIEDLCKYIIAPDFPTKAEIISSPEELLAMYKTGNGTVRVRSLYVIEKNNIVITALPYMVSGAKVLKQIADQINNKSLQLIVDLRDESDHQNPTRLVLVPKSNRVDLDPLMLHLFATTDLERTYRVNFNMIGINGGPKVKNLLEILTEWLEFRITLVAGKLNYRLDYLNNRLEILQGLLTIYLQIDEVIRIIRFEEDPKLSLMQKFKLTELQVEAILDLKLRSLAKLEEIKLQQELAQFKLEQQNIIQILSSKEKLKTLVKTEIKELSNKLQDPRNSKVINRESARILDLNANNKNNDTEITVVLSDKGWVRCGKGHEFDVVNLNYRTGEHYKAHAYGLANQSVIFLDSTGKSYSLVANNLPSMRGYGEPLTSKLSPSSGAIFESVIIGEDLDRIFLLQERGYGFITYLKNLQAKTKTGKAVFNLKDSKLLSSIKLTQDPKYCVMITDDSKLLMLEVGKIPELAKGRGGKLIKLSNKQHILGIQLLGEKSNLIITNGKQEFIIKFKELLNYLGEPGSSALKIVNLPKYKNITNISLQEQLI